MILITDSNIIISALIKPQGTVAQIFKQKSSLQFMAPDYLFDEVKEHWDKIVSASTLSKKELAKELIYYRDRIKVYEVTKIKKEHLAKAEKIVEDIDPDDVFFIALHLHLKHKIWCSDNVLIKGVEAKGYKIFVTTAELKTKLYKKEIKLNNKNTENFRVFLCVFVKIINFAQNSQIMKVATKNSKLAGAVKPEKKLSKKAQEIKNAFEKAREISASLIEEGKFVPFNKNLIYGNQ